jgi:hypothetical protein
MAERSIAAILILLFGCLLYVALGNIVHLAETRTAGDVLVLLYCVIFCLGWIVFLAVLFLAGRPTQDGALGGSPWREGPASVDAY